jgi:hypothetical protein
MSAIGMPKIISSHANYRREDYMFPRTQSRSLNERRWERREGPLHSWSEILYPAASVIGISLIVLCASL